MLDDSDVLLECPYQKSHLIQKSRMQTHLVKCKLANGNPQQNVEPIVLKICKFNSNHHLPAAELDAHHLTCPDIGVLTRFVMSHGNGTGNVIPYVPIDLPPTSENWDEDGDVKTYDPSEHVTSGGSVIIRSMAGAPKSDRKTFRLQERERVNLIRATEEASAKVQKVVAPKPQSVAAVEKHAFTDQPLRHPKSGQLGMGRGRLVQNNPVNEGPMMQESSGLGRGTLPAVGRACTLKGMSNSLQDIPAMRSKVNKLPGVNSKQAAKSAGHPDAGAASSKNSQTSVHSSHNGVDSKDAHSENANECADMLASVHLGEDSQGFVVQQNRKKTRKNKSGQATAADKTTRNPLLNGQVPSNEHKIGSALHPFKVTIPASMSDDSFPGLPGKGRGRLSFPM